MIRTKTLLVIVFAAAALGWATGPLPEGLIRQGSAAFRGGDYVGAAALFERAEVRATDPGLVTFDLAAARHRQALAEGGSPALLREAARLYRCCLGRDDPRRPRALYGLGTCLIQSATPASDVEALRQAIDCFERCLREPGADEWLRADGRYNLQRARLLLAQAVAAGAPDEHSPGEDKEPDPAEKKPVDESEGGAEARREGNPDARGVVPAEAQPGEQPTPTDAPPAPGKGTLPPVPDSAERAPLAPADAAEHLRQAARRIRAERQAFRKGRGRATAGVRDW
jgi:hypothetical protein